VGLADAQVERQRIAGRQIEFFALKVLAFSLPLDFCFVEGLGAELSASKQIASAFAAKYGIGHEAGLTDGALSSHFGCSAFLLLKSFDWMFEM
jgi:hypothetical protein